MVEKFISMTINNLCTSNYDFNNIIEFCNYYLYLKHEYSYINNEIRQHFNNNAELFVETFFKNIEPSIKIKLIEYYNKLLKKEFNNKYIKYKQKYLSLLDKINGGMANWDKNNNLITQIKKYDNDGNLYLVNINIVDLPKEM